MTAVFANRAQCVVFIEKREFFCNKDLHQLTAEVRKKTRICLQVLIVGALYGYLEITPGPIMLPLRLNECRSCRSASFPDQANCLL